MFFDPFLAILGKFFYITMKILSFFIQLAKALTFLSLYAKPVPTSSPGDPPGATDRPILAVFKPKKQKPFHEEEEKK